jgi:hypothetical protein
VEYLYIKVKENMEIFDKYVCVCVERCENLRVILTIVLEIHRVENVTPRHQGQNHPFRVSMYPDNWEICDKYGGVCGSL